MFQNFEIYLSVSRILNLNNLICVMNFFIKLRTKYKILLGDNIRLIFTVKNVCSGEGPPRRNSRVVHSYFHVILTFVWEGLTKGSERSEFHFRSPSGSLPFARPTTSFLEEIPKGIQRHLLSSQFQAPEYCRQ